MIKDGYNTYRGKAFRYISFKGFSETIANETLRFTKIDNFNDPLDSSPYLAPFDWEKYNFDNGLTNILNKYFLSVYFNSIYACCFCKNYSTLNSYLMWSHYGDMHTQMCFEIDFSKTDYLGGPSEVIYPDDLYEYREEQKNMPSMNRGLYVATTKLKQWSYEEEVRLIIDTSFIAKEISTTNFDSNKQHLYYPLNLEVISKVIFGIKSEKEEELAVLKLLKNKGVNPLYEKMILDPVSLKLKAIDYNNYLK